MSTALVAPTPSTETQSFSLTPRQSADLNGKIVGLLDNTKFNSDRLLDSIGELLQQRYDVEDVVRDRKGYFGRPVPDDHARELASRCDVLITATGD